MMKKYLLLIGVILLFAFSNISCKKSKENKLVGSWQYQPLNNVENSNETQIWNFDGTNIIKITSTQEDTTYTYTGTYTVSSKFIGLKGYYVEISGVYLYWNGIYKIEKIKSSVLVLNRVAKNADSENPGVEGGEFLWKEFVKK